MREREGREKREKGAEEKFFVRKAGKGEEEGGERKKEQKSWKKENGKKGSIQNRFLECSQVRK